MTGLYIRPANGHTAPGLRRNESTGVCLNTEDPGNVPLYEHMGYRTLAHRRIDDDLETWCMFRPRDHDEAQMHRGP